MCKREQVYEVPAPQPTARQWWIEVLDLGVSTGAVEGADKGAAVDVRRPSAFTALP